MRKWLKKLIKEVVDDSICNYSRIWGKRIEDFDSRLSKIDTSTYGTNANRLQTMMNELKGIVSMARAALDEGRKFTEIREIGNILNLVSEDIQRFNINLDKFGMHIEQFDDLNWNLIACVEILKKKTASVKKAVKKK